MHYIELIYNAGLDSLWLCLKILLILAPLMVIYEVAKAYGLFERTWPGADKIMSGLGLGHRALIPLLAGLFLGLFYGAGILIAMCRDNSLDNKERLALVVFLATCHSVIEDTAVFALVGGSAVTMLIPRILLALVITAFLAYRLKSKSEAGR